jgi:hypothetical protein
MPIPWQAWSLSGGRLDGSLACAVGAAAWDSRALARCFALSHRWLARVRDNRPWRDAVLELWEVLRYGADSYGDLNYVSIYRWQPADWYARGVRLLGRTAVECTRDTLADAIGQDIAAVSSSAPRSAAPIVIDPFAGSGNTLYWILRHLPDARGVGFELDPSVFELTS